MIRFALLFLLGVLIFQTSRTLPPFYIVIGFPAVAVLYYYFPRGRYAYIVVLGFLWSYLFAAVRLVPVLSPQFEGVDVTIVGSITEVRKNAPNYARFIFKLSNSQGADLVARLPAKLSLSWYYPEHALVSHQNCRLRVRLKKHWRFANPGSADREKQMFLDGIGARGYVRSGECQPAATVASRAGLRTRLLDNFARMETKYRNFGLMQALTFGERGRMQTSQWEILRATGTSHLLAISGLHLSAISVVAFFIATFLAKLSANLCERIPAQCVAAIFAMLATSVYAYLAGFSIPTQRALIMVFIAFGAILLRKPLVQFSVLATALFAVLLLNPLAVLTVSFWMSFLAVMFIFIILKTSVGLSKFSILFRVQIFLAAALLPVSMRFFTQGSLIAPIVNLIAVPYVSFLLLPVLMIAQLLFLTGTDSLSHFLFSAVDRMFDLLQWWLQFCAQLPLASIYYHPTIAGVILYELGLLLLIQPRGFPLRPLAPVFLVALFFIRDYTLTENQLRVTVLDVGQGLAVVIETKNHTLLYDAGPKFTSGFNTGTAVVLPYLRKRNIKVLDKIIVSHNDNDHAGGVQALLDAATVDTLTISNGKDKYSANRIDYCRQGDEWIWDGVGFRILHPPNSWQSSPNNRSCVVQIMHPAGSVLLAGDIETAVERRLIAEYGDKLRSHLLLAPHHGSMSSSSRRFLARVRPQTAVFSVGYRNRYGFPHAKITARYQSIGAELVDTTREGAVTFIFDSRHGMQREVGYRPSSRRYWNSIWEHSIDPG